MFKIIENMLSTNFSQWKTILTTNVVELWEVEIKCDIFQNDALSPLLFIPVLIPQTITCNKKEYHYLLSKEASTINNLLLMYLYGSSKRELQSLVNTVRIISADTGMKFSMDKYKKLLICKEKLIGIDDTEMSDGEHRKHVEQDGYKHLDGFQDSQIKTAVMKEKI